MPRLIPRPYAAPTPYRITVLRMDPEAPTQNQQAKDVGKAILSGSAFSTMHRLHWLIIFLSLVVTIAAWRITSSQIQEKAANTYERETSKILDLVLERMQRYEDALWAGAIHINAIGGDIQYRDWKRYAEAVSIERKYPGINGIGVVHYVAPDRLHSYLTAQRVDRPSYRIHPDHDKQGFWPISYIIPEKGNEKAVGLDMAHESNRYAAAQLARDTGEARITGPITLVQDEQHTPGFLFFVPFYRSSTAPLNVEERRETFVGLIYAPFVVNNLVDGVLSRELRSITFSISDGSEEIFNEDAIAEHEFDNDPLFQSSSEIELYGRTWTFRFRSSKEFRRDLSSDQPMTILIGGILVDLLLLMLFVLISRNNRRNAHNAQMLLQAQKKVERANEELSHFNYRTSHDLVAPLKTIRGYVDLAKYQIEDKDIEGISDCLSRIGKQASRLEKLVEDLLNLCRIENQDSPPEAIDPHEIFDFVSSTLQSLWEEKGVQVTFENHLQAPFYAESVRVRQIMENLVSNGIKYSDPQKSERWVKVSFTPVREGWIRLEVADNGIGIPDESRDKVYEMFYRAGNNSEFGSGLGNYLVKKHVSSLNGTIDYRSSPQGTTFHVDIPAKMTGR
ncbi:CHASE domain-containing sensor histidine kinase [Pelagicoccus enzymogenes]|uniref:CHASE domain-containing sensor histidine kinase n=1 Tax=Pelagicoccus enzymogenes TaxID=2773457 RepID=UPI0028123260|nr:CHASE domain-containing protein [Pelagicoccus enzymogenes]